MAKKILCQHCRSADVELNDDYYAIIQQKTNDGVPIGKKRTFLVFVCRSCGKTFYTDEIESVTN